jgi:hypothetical protein
VGWQLSADPNRVFVSWREGGMTSNFFDFFKSLVVASVAVVFLTSRASAVEPESFSTLPVNHSISEHLLSFANLNEDANYLPIVDIGLRQKKPTWDFNVGAAILTRGTQSGSWLLREVVPPPAFRSVGIASQLDSNWAGGLDITGTRELSPSRRFDAVNVRYFDVQGLQSAAAVDVTGLFVGPAYPGAGVFGKGTGNAVFEQGTDLYSFEANGVTHASEWIDLLTGFRWIGMNDSLSYVVNTRDTFDNTYTGGNSLYGGQIGANIKVLDTGRRLEVYCAPKAGLFLNQAVGVYEKTSTGNRFNRVFRNQLAFAGDISVNARYRLTKAFSVQVGYQLLWLNGIATAADQAAVMGPDNSTGRAFDSSGSAFFHGALVGGNFVW